MTGSALSSSSAWLFWLVLPPLTSRSVLLEGRRVGRSPWNPPPPSGGSNTACQTKLRILQISEFSNSKSLYGPNLRRRPNRADVLLTASASLFQIFLNFLLAQKIIKNRTSIKSSQNLKIRTPGCPKLDFGTILDDFWHHFFDQFSWPPKSHNLQQLYCENLFFTISGLSF